MKKIFKYILVGLAAMSVIACSEDSLETSPSSSASGDDLLKTATNALIPLNGVYRAMYTAGVSTDDNTHQCFGITAYNLMADVMGEDLIMSGAGSGWFWYDCVYNVKARYTSEAWRSYDMWNAYYIWISNVNYILAAEKTMSGSDAEKNYVIGQAYAVRAYSYFMLAQTFARTYKGHESEPCVPIYTEPTTISTKGNPRSTNEAVYKLITEDINKAVTMLEGAKRKHISHINQAVALGIKARIALVMEDWQTAFDASTAAIAKSGCETAAVSAFKGVNSSAAPNVMWGVEILKDQAGMYGSLFAHMDADAKKYGASARKQISKKLYEKMGPKDTRLAWWNPKDKSNEEGGYQQEKFKFSNIATWEGDYVFMRVEEMELTAAEAACRIPGQEKVARLHLNNVMEQRDADFDVTAYSGTELGKLTSDETGSLLEQIIIQRRIELWGEFGRIYDIRRLKQGFTRTLEMGWPESALIKGTNTQSSESYAWVLTIPQSEFDGNSSLDPAKDQNPIGDSK